MMMKTGKRGYHRPMFHLSIDIVDNESFFSPRLQMASDGFFGSCLSPSSPSSCSQCITPASPPPSLPSAPSSTPSSVLRRSVHLRNRKSDLSASSESRTVFLSDLLDAGLLQLRDQVREQPNLSYLSPCYPFLFFFVLSSHDFLLLLLSKVEFLGTNE
jgi:hypothetical protein